MLGRRNNPSVRCQLDKRRVDRSTKKEARHGSNTGFHNNMHPIVFPLALLSARTAKTWLGTSIRPGLDHNPALVQDETPVIDAAGKSTAMTQFGYNTALSPSSSSRPYPRSDLGSGTDSGNNLVVASDSQGPAGDGGLRGKAPTTIAGSGSGTSPSSSTTEGTPGGVGEEQLPQGTGSTAMEVESKPIQRKIISAAEAARTAVVAAVIAGLARDWVCPRDWDGCLGGDRPGGSQQASGVIDHHESALSGQTAGTYGNATQSLVTTQGGIRLVPSRQAHISTCNERTQRNIRRRERRDSSPGDVPSPPEQAYRRVAIPTQEAATLTRPKASMPVEQNTAGSPTLGSAVVSGTGAAQRSRLRKGRQADGSGGGGTGEDIASGAFSTHDERSTDATAMSTDATSVLTGVADPGIKCTLASEAAVHFFPTPMASQHGQLLVAEAEGTAGNAFSRSSSLDGPKHGMNGRKGLIRTIGRAKRGPCMLTLSSSLQHGGDHKIRNWYNRKEQPLRRKAVVWETEANGGLLGSGEIKVLVC